MAMRGGGFSTTLCIMNPKYNANAEELIGNYSTALVDHATDAGCMCHMTHLNHPLSQL